MAKDDFDLGRHEALITRLVEGQDRLLVDVAEIKGTLAERRGERRVAIWSAGTLGGILGALVPIITRIYLGVNK